MLTSPTSDRGTAALLVAGSLVLLLGMAALAIDLGAGWNERRQDQTASDLAAVAGALSYPDNDDAITQVLNVARLNLDSDHSDSNAWLTLWTSCVDTDPAWSGLTPLIEPTTNTPIDCISSNGVFFRVKLPDQLVATSFGRVFGVQTLSTGADTVIRMLPPQGTGLLPFAVTSGSQIAEICLDTGPGQVDEPCQSNEAGSFGNIAPPLFGDPILGTEPSCSSQTSANNHVADAIAMGMDHLIDRFTSSQWASSGFDTTDKTSNNDVDAVANMDECVDTGGVTAQAADGAPINAVYVDTGNNVKADSTEGLLTGTNFADGGDARLTRNFDPNNNYNLPRISFDGIPGVDNTPLWTHLLPVSEHGISQCNPTLFTGTTASRYLQLNDCFEDWKTSSRPVIFSDSILATPRFGVAPVLWHDNLGSGISYRPVKDFALVYVTGIVLNDGPANQTIWYADGTTNAITPSKKTWIVDQVTAYQLDMRMTSANVQNYYPGFDPDDREASIFE